MDITNVSGCATGSTVAEAVLSGLLEVVERDTFMIAWASQLPVTGLRLLPGSPGEVGLYATAFSAVGIEVRCATVTLDWAVPMVVAIGHSRNPGDPSAVVAAAADIDVTTACSRALKELTANLAYARHRMASLTGPTPADASQVRTQEDHMLLYARREMWHHLEHWWSPARHEELSDVAKCSAAEALAKIQIRVADSGGDVLVVDVSHSELRSRGLHTVKVLVPGAYPMNFDSLWPHHGGRRILHVPCDVGLMATPLAVSDLNSTPHPFP
jgi:ribosomal protein S12 methylthiotransferase accessory factor